MMSGSVLTEDLPSIGLAGQCSQAGSPSRSAAESACREAGQYEARRQAGAEAAPDYGDSRDASTAKLAHGGLGLSCRMIPELVVVPGCSAVPALTASVLPLLSQAEPGNKGSRPMSVQVHARVAA